MRKRFPIGTVLRPLISQRPFFMVSDLRLSRHADARAGLKPEPRPIEVALFALFGFTEGVCLIREKQAERFRNASKRFQVVAVPEKTVILFIGSKNAFILEQGKGFR